jgi:hypothetical protein
MLRMCVYMHFRFVKNHPIRILKDGPSFLRRFCHSSTRPPAPVATRPITGFRHNRPAPASSPPPRLRLPPLLLDNSFNRRPGAHLHSGVDLEQRLSDDLCVGHLAVRTNIRPRRALPRRCTGSAPGRVGTRTPRPWTG